MISMKKSASLLGKIKELREAFETSEGSLCPLELKHLNMKDQPEKTVQDILKTIEEINQRPAKIAKTAYDNIYLRRNEWYGKDNKKLFTAPINDIIYKETYYENKSNGKKVLINMCVPLKDEYLDPNSNQENSKNNTLDLPSREKQVRIY